MTTDSSDGKQPRAGGSRSLKKWLVGTLLAAGAGVIAANALSLNDWLLGLFRDHTPVSASAETVSPTDFCNGGDGWLIPDGGAAATPPVESAEAASWKGPVGTIPASPLKVSILLQSTHNASPTITDVSAINVHRLADKPRQHFVWRPDGCGGKRVSHLDLGLRMAAPTEAETPITDLSNGRDDDVFPRTITPQSPDEYDLYIYAADGAYSFDLRIEWAYDGKDGAVELNNDGSHYLVGSIGESRQYVSNGAAWDEVSTREAEGYPTFGASTPIPIEVTRKPKDHDRSTPLRRDGIVDYTHNGDTTGAVIRRKADLAKLVYASDTFHEYVGKLRHFLSTNYRGHPPGCAPPDLTIERYSSEGYAYGTAFDCRVPTWKYLLIAKISSTWQTIYFSASPYQSCRMLRSYNYPKELLSFSASDPNVTCINVNGSMAKYEPEN